MSEQKVDSIPVVVAMNFSDAIMEQIRAVSPRLRVERHHPNVPDKAWNDAEIVYTVRNFPTVEQAPRLRWMQLHSAGIDHAVKEPILTDAADVEVTTTSGIHAGIIAEYCIMGMLAFEFGLPTMLDYQARAEWAQNRFQVFAPRSLRGQTLGIVGYGAIGRELARLADQFGMKVLATKRDVMHTADKDGYVEPGTGDPTGDIPTRIYPPQATAGMAKACDFLVVTLPLTSATRHSINADVLKAMKKTAILINIGRGAVVDEAELISALAAERIRGAVLDVFEEEPLPATSPLWNLPNVIISPHIAGMSLNYHEKAAGVFIENLGRYLNNRPLLNRVIRERGY
ncbi:MAG: D-2-hydroxyacid dehydrogenase [Chloroflexota bacterium]|nr:D-2-hydroxyacid dehydrogenase [Chloroflexota bacterium]